MMMENAWYPWTKMLAAFFVVFALSLYLTGWRGNEGTRIIAAFVCLAAGLLVHYSAGPYTAILAGHYLLRVFWGRPHKVRELAAIGIACVLLLATWFGWSIKTYGARATFASNTSITSAQAYQGNAVAKMAANLYDTVVPPLLRDPESSSAFRQPNEMANVRDDAFIVYQANMIFGMGLIGGPFVLWLLYRALRRPDASPERGFWLVLIPLAIILGIAVVGERDPMGSAHLTLLPLEALGITLIAASFPWSRVAATLLLAGCVVDFSFGIFLHVRIENLDNPPATTVFQGLTVASDGIHIGETGPNSLNRAAWSNWLRKHLEKNVNGWIAALAAMPPTPAVQGMAGQMRSELAENSRNFGGWYSRHGGETRMIGDAFSRLSLGFLDAPSILFLILFGCLLFRLWQESVRLALPLLCHRPPPRKNRHPASAKKPPAGGAWSLTINPPGHGLLRSHHCAFGVFVVRRAACHRQDDPAVVRRIVGGLEHLHALLSDDAVAGVSLRSLVK